MLYRLPEDWNFRVSFETFFKILNLFYLRCDLFEYFIKKRSYKHTYNFSS